MPGALCRCHPAPKLAPFGSDGFVRQVLGCHSIDMVASTLAAVAVAVMAMTGVAVVVAAAAMMGAPGSGSPFLCSTSGQAKRSIL